MSNVYVGFSMFSVPGGKGSGSLRCFFFSLWWANPVFALLVGVSRCGLGLLFFFGIGLLMTAGGVRGLIALACFRNLAMAFPHGP